MPAEDHRAPKNRFVFNRCRCLESSRRDCLIVNRRDTVFDTRTHVLSLSDCGRESIELVGTSNGGIG